MWKEYCIETDNRRMDMKQFILYGAGINGKKLYNFLNARGLGGMIYSFCDRNYEKVNNIGAIPVKCYRDVMNLKIPFIITVGNAKYREEIAAKLKDDGQFFYNDIFSWMESYFQDTLERDRNIIAYYHVDNDYYKNVDNEKDLDIFWGINSPFYGMFKQLDLSNVIELACGEGRHVCKYLESAGHIVLVDILENNLEVCKERYKESDKISYYCNNGNNLEKLKDNRYSALFTYDAMVHFEMLDIYSYLKDVFRVLVPGGKALFHHSNNGKNYKTGFLSNVQCRNFMSKELFAYMAYKCGFEIIAQQVIDWGKGEDFVKDLDCITLVEKQK